MGALSAGFLLLQVETSQSSTETFQSQLAAADRGADATASRGSARSTDPSPIAEQIELASENPSFLAAVDELDPTTTTTTTEAPTTTTTAKPTTTTTRPKPIAKPPVEATPAGEIGSDVWTRLARCESGLRNDAGAPYYGYFQFSAQTWRGVGGAGLPTDHTYEVQLEFAKKLQARSGWGQWPICGPRAVRG